MSLESDVRRMAATRPFSLLPREAVQLLAFSCERRNLKAEEKLFAAGEVADCAFLVLSGEIVLVAGSEERRVSRGALIGETALAAEVLRGADARASVDTALLRVPRDVFRRVLTEFPDAAAKVHASAAARTRQLIGRLEALRARAFEV
jgi:CRP-like cAMP-binding protein